MPEEDEVRNAAMLVTHYFPMSLKEHREALMWEYSLKPKTETILSPLLSLLLLLLSCRCMAFVNHPWLVGHRAWC